MKEHYCEICGKDTRGVDYDYLVGSSHLACVIDKYLPNYLKEEMKNKKKKPVQIGNWEKLNGQEFDVMGARLVIMDTIVEYLSEGNAYQLWIHPWNDSEALVKVTLWADNMQLQIKVLPPMDYDSIAIPIELTTTITKNHISNPSIFVQTICEGLTDDPSVRDIISFVSRKQDMRSKGTGYSPGPGISGSSGNNLW